MVAYLCPMDNEIWKPVVGWEGLYEVSSLGRVRSLPRKSATRRLGVRGKVLKPRKGQKGHLIVNLSVDRTTGGRSEKHFVHSLVLEAFVGPRPEGKICRHLLGNPDDNFPNVLAWGTHMENHEDAVRHGTFQRGEDRAQALLTEADVVQMREAAAAGAATKYLASRFGIAYRTANHIITGTKWRHAGGPIKKRRKDCYLSDTDVRDIRTLAASGRSLNSIGKQYGLPPNSIKKIRDRQYYAWVD